MSISMIGVDHNKASVDVRALFSFTRKNAGEAMERLKEYRGIKGCIILSTCNRLEIWVSMEEDARLSLYECLCSLKGMENRDHQEYFVSRKGKEAVSHLFYLTSGLKSQIIGEDQILTQVKEALNLAREHFTTDNVLEVLFRTAVTAGKRIKTEVPLAHGNPSVIHRAIHCLKDQGISVEQKICMVIGNGEMGKVAAQTLQENGADVTVTVREYRSGIVQIPAGCKRINYTERMQQLPKCDLVVSATASPNFTLREELFENVELEKPLILIDLAVPRDIEPRLGERKGITLYDMDSFQSEAFSDEMKESLLRADAIVAEEMEGFFQWLEGRDFIPRIAKIREEAVQDFHLRIEKIMRNTPMEEADRQKLFKSVDETAGKVVAKLIFGLRDSLNKESFGACVEGMEKIYEE